MRFANFARSTKSTWPASFRACSRQVSWWRRSFSRLIAIRVKCFCSVCQEDTHSTEHHGMFKRIVGKPKAKETDGKPRHNKAMSATTATKSDNGKMYCLSAKYSDAQATEPGSCPLELIDSPEPEFTVTAHGDGSVGNSFIAIDLKNCYTNEPSNTTGQPFMAPGSRRFSAVSPGNIQPLILNLRVPSTLSLIHI